MTARPDPRPLRIDWTAAEADRKADYAGRVMTRNGVPVDHKAAWALYKRLDGLHKELTEEIRTIVPSYRPTPSGIYDTVFRQLGCSPDLELPDAVALTDSGDYSIDHRALCGIVRKLKPQSQAYEAVRRIILANKAKTTRNNAKGLLSRKRLAKLAALGVEVPAPEDYHVVDGRIHPRFSPKTLNGRYAANKPNIHSFNGAIKGCFSRPGWVFIQIDADQIHIRIQANEWRIPRLLDTLVSGDDPHMAAMRVLLGDLVLSMLSGFRGWAGNQKPAGGSDADACRQRGKVLNYTGAYGGGAATLLAASLRDVDTNGIPTMPDASLAQFQDLLRKRKEREPAWAEHYARVRAEWKRNGYLQTSATQRRFLCKSGKVTELYNCTVLGFEADLMGALTYEAAMRWPRYLVNQSHDSLVLFAPESEAPDLLVEITKLMNVHYVARKGAVKHPIPYTASGSISRTLKEGT